MKSNTGIFLILTSMLAMMLVIGKGIDKLSDISNKDSAEELVITYSSIASEEYVKTNDISIEVFLNTLNYLLVNKITDTNGHISANSFYFTIHDPDNDNRVIIESALYHNYLTSELTRKAILLDLLDWIDVINEHK